MDEEVVEVFKGSLWFMNEANKVLTAPVKRYIR